MKKFIGFITMMMVLGLSAQNQHFFTQINSSENDAEEDKDGGAMDLSSSDVELSFDPGTLTFGDQDQWIGLRFTNITLPEKVIIDSAFIQFTVDETESDPAISQFYGEKTFNSTAFVDLDNNISSRNRTDTSVYWTIPAWNTEHDASDLQKSPNLKPIVEEIISQSLWQSGNAMSFIIEGSGTRTAEAYDGESQLAPVLHIYYKIDYTNTVDFHASELKIYPNPVQDILHIDLNSQINSTNVAFFIYSADGKEIKALSSPVEKNIKVDVSGLYPGVYMLKSTLNNHTTVQRFIKK